MADRCDRLAGVEEMPDHGDDVGIRAQIFRFSPARDNEHVVSFRPRVAETAVELEVVAAVNPIEFESVAAA